MSEIIIFLLVLWGVIAFTCIILELVSNSFIAIWFAFGSIIALILGAVGLAWYWQFLGFILASFITLIIGYPTLKKLVLNKKSIKTNVDALINQKAVMLNDYDSNNINNVGLAKLDGKTWTIESYDKTNKYSKDEEVLVIGINGVRIIVKKIKSGE